jgi:uncharacterized membrane protein YphA (DoxX/SURF4 family)
MTRWLTTIGRVLLGAVFIYAAYTKLRHPWALFALSIDSYRMLPEWGVVAVARGLPWVELGLGVLLLTGMFLRFAASVASALLLVFIGVMVRAQIRGLGIDCGCFGVGEALSVKTLLRDGLLVLVSLLVTAGAFLSRRKVNPEPKGTQTPQPVTARSK